jgi:uncharacterized OsmC-like protein
MASSQEIKAALDRAANMVTLKPAVGQRSYVNTAVVEDGLSCHVQEKAHTLTVDLPQSMGGENTGPSPSTLLRAALSSCVAIGIKMWASRRSVIVDRIEVRVETDVDARGQFGVADTISPGFEGVRIAIDIASHADADVLDDIIRTSLRYSPLMDALQTALSLETQISIQPPIRDRQ